MLVRFNWRGLGKGDAWGLGGGGGKRYVIKLIPIPRPPPINHRLSQPFIPKITPLPRKIISHLLLQRQIEEFFADIEKRIRVVEEGVSEEAGVVTWFGGFEV